MNEKALTPGCTDLNKLEIQEELGTSAELLWSLRLLFQQQSD